MQTIHINLVSDQLIPNLIPTFADANCAGVVLVLGDTTLSERADRLMQLYKGRGLPILWCSEGSSSYRLAPLQQQARELIEWLSQQHADKNWVLNATCGTKPMALAFVDAFNSHNASRPEEPVQALIVYTDTQNREIPLLNQGVDYALPYRSVLTLEELLTANGFESTASINTDNDSDVRQRASLTNYLGRQFNGHCAGMLGQLQRMASEAYKEFPLQQNQSMPGVPHGNYAALYQRLVDEGLLAWDGQNRQIRFLSEDACRYLAGRWLEELTYLAALECGFEAVAMSVEGEWATNRRHLSVHEPHNEFDVLVLHNNQLLAIECKANNWFKSDADVSKNQDVLHKLDALGSKLGGLFGTRLLVTAQPLTDPARARAQQVHIKLCERATHTSIKQMLQSWKADIA